MSNQIVNLDKVGKHKLMLVLRQDSNVFFSFFSDPFADAAKGGENDVQDGLVHISELADKRVAKVGDVVKEGDEVSVKVVGFDRGKVKLSMKQASA